MAYQVRIVGMDQVFSVRDGESILDGALRAGASMPHDCQFGGCGTCRIKVESGVIRYDEFPMALAPEEAAQGYALACQAKPTEDLVVNIARKTIPFAAPRRVTARVVHIRNLTPGIRHLSLELPEGIDLDYRPGQYMNVLLGQDAFRSFSMASPPVPGGNQVDFHVRRIAGGYFTDRVLSSLNPGQELQIEIPLGEFCYHEEDWRPLLMVATGTGVAPIKAILQSLLDRGDCPPVSLYWGMRTESDLYLLEEIASWKDRLCDFSFVPVLSRAEVSWQGRTGYVQQAVCDDFPDLSEHAVYLCGSPSMIGDAKSLFLQQGAEPAYIYADGFSFQHQSAFAD